MTSNYYGYPLNPVSFFEAVYPNIGGQKDVLSGTTKQ